MFVIDDQMMVVEAVRRMLSSESDIEFHSCTDPAKAVEMAINIEPTVILLDLVMPEIDGMTLVRFFRQNKKTEDIPIIVLSSIDAPIDKGAAFSAGASDYIVKLPDRIELIARVRAHSKSYSNKLERDAAFAELHKLKAELEESNNALQLLSCLDGLTGIANRRRFDDFMASEWKRAVRENSTITLIMIDIDYFKAYNDNYGHQKGDETLKSVVSALNQGINRPADLLARYGGEEFVIVLPDTTMAGALQLAKSLMHNVDELGLPHDYSEVSSQVTISVGIACCEPEIRHNTVESLIEAADQALYEAKAQGRNQIVISKTCKGRCQLEEFQGDHQEAGREGSSRNVNRESSRKKH